MESGDIAVTLALKKSGLRNWIGLVAGFRFAQGTRYKRTSKRTIYWCYEIFTELAVLINAITQFAALLSPGMKMTDRCLICFPLVSCILCLFMSNYSRFQRRPFALLVESYEKAFSNCQYRDHLEEEIKKGAEHVRFITMVLVLLEYYPMLTFCLILPVVNEATSFALGPRKVVIPSLWPWNPLTSFTNFIIVVFSHTCGSTFVTLKKIGFEESFFMYASRQISLFKHLGYNLERIFEPLVVNEDGTVSRNEFTNPNRYLMERKLAQWAKDHQNCLSLFKELEALYEWPMLVYFGATILILCNATYVASDNSVDTQTCVTCGAFAVGIVFELLFICRMGDLIKHETAELLHALSGKNAFLLNTEEHSYLRMILTRCKSESVIRALGGFPLNISTFKSITTSSYSYYTMLKEVNGKPKA